MAKVKLNKVKLTRKPRTAEEFIEEAEAPLTVSVPKPEPEQPPESSQDAMPESGPEPVKKKARRKRYPWNSPKVRDDLMKSFNLRLSEPYFLKLRYISERTQDSMRSFIIKVLKPAIDRKIESIVEKDKQD